MKGLFSSFLCFINFLLQLKHQFHFRGVLVCQRLNQDLTFFNLSLELFNEAEVVTSNSQDLFIFLIDHSLHLVDVAVKSVSVLIRLPGSGNDQLLVFFHLI